MRPEKLTRLAPQQGKLEATTGRIGHVDRSGTEIAWNPGSKGDQALSTSKLIRLRKRKGIFSRPQGSHCNVTPPCLCSGEPGFLSCRGKFLIWSDSLFSGEGGEGVTVLLPRQGVAEEVGQPAEGGNSSGGGGPRACGGGKKKYCEHAARDASAFLSLP